MRSITLTDLKNPQLLNSLVTLVKSEHETGTIKEQILNVRLIKHRGLTKATALKVMELSNLPL